MAASSEFPNSDQKNGNFLCGVVEGFYGRPWTTEQRKDLFRKMRRWGMDSYVYAPKDDYKHRAYWRELYTVEEADHLTGLITAAKEQGIVFYYALSPGLDMTYSNPKEVLALKRKLDQVSQFGCQAFALLFDDIEAELSKTDKEVFKTFANAQVSVTNDIFNHLNGPKFLFCPTQYCSSRAVPSVTHSEYLNTLGSKLCPEIDIMWTGAKVISKFLNVELIQEITEVLRRPPVIWDNLHANDYDQKRVFLGPYSGRSPELIPLLRGVLTNPNCEFHANTIAIHTLAYWSKCSLDTKVNNSISADIKLETENDDGIGNEDIPACLSKNIYHPRVALKNAIIEWLPEFSIQKEAWGPISKPQPPVTMVMPIIPIIPSVNTCMSLTTTTTTTSSASKTKMPEVNTTQLQALADVCSTAVTVSQITPISNAVMNSLVSPTKVITNDTIPNPITSTVATNIEIPKKIPISSVPIPIMNMKNNDTKSIIDIDKNDIDNVELDVDCNTTSIDDNNCLNKDVTSTNIDDDNMKISEVERVEEDVCNEDVNHENEIEKTASVIEDDVQIAECEQSFITTTDTCVTTTTTTTTTPIVQTSHTITDDDNIENDDNQIKRNGSCNGEEKLESPVATIALESLTTNNGTVTTTSSLPVVATTESMHILEENPSPHSFTEPMECGSSSVNSQGSPKRVAKSPSDDVVMSETVSTSSGSMQVESSDTSLVSNAEMTDDFDRNNDKNITVEDLYLLCDLFYLPFEHGSRALQLLNEFYWLKTNAHVLLQNKSKKNEPVKPEVQEWIKRSEKFFGLCQAVHVLSRKIASCANKELCYDLFSYVWDIAGVISLLNAFIKWLSLGNFPSNINSYTQGSYTWFSKGWKETFTSGDQEPWVFRGGLTADLQRLMPVDSGNDLFIYKLPDIPTTNHYIIRPFTYADEQDVYGICHKTCRDGSDCSELFPENLQGIPADRLVGPFITLHPELCMIVQNSNNIIIGYACAALDARTFYRNQEMCWLPAMCEKYPLTLLDSTNLTQTAKDSINHFHNFQYECPQEVLTSYPSIMTCCILKDESQLDQSISKRLITVLLAALRSNGSFGVHVCINQTDSYMFQFYTKLGFQEIYRDSINTRIYLGRNF